MVYDFIDNEEFFSSGNPYISLIDDIPKYCYFAIMFAYARPPFSMFASV